MLVHNCDPATAEKEMQSFLQKAFPGKTIGQGKLIYGPDGKVATDHDVFGDNFICEVTCGKGGGKVGQVQDRLLPNTGGKPLAVYGPKLRPGPAARIEELGVPVFRTMDDVAAWVGRQ
ncbi:hypothetical protein P3T36_005408 [Kitasatospora sp. MAP12-15]|uniref:hypothetical protein n=1 Tax=unclassified Kitasatospora TaxID=2633591 RepID=UPI002474F04F|nr:hypothetical protein [Kitasatospora sp. MAP12-44]MDH6109791.1 hypothetical protein [Kitasatospora sp. MAP12-44]